ncbi:MAG: sulfite exporter TauE/SafE family protein, partial [Betaproteobacteria bacterium]|nr:sulfite exporter TauE/SafE family protein [Betaproteobacteria bacterium]
RLWRSLQPLTGRALLLPVQLRFAALGALWGFLPCGLVYSALAVAATSGSAAGGALIMLAFGLGTLPAMVAATLLGTALLRRLSGAKTRTVAGLLMLLFAAWTAAGPLPHLRAAGPDAPTGASQRHH